LRGGDKCQQKSGNAFKSLKKWLLKYAKGILLLVRQVFLNHLKDKDKS